MNLVLDIINAYLFVSVLLAAFCAMYSFSKRRSAIHILFAVTCMLIMIYTFGYMMEINVGGLDQKIFWNQVQYFAIPFFPAVWLMTAMEFTDNRFKNALWIRILIFTVPISTFMLRITNENHHFYYKDIAIKAYENFSVLALEKAPWYVIHSIFVAVCIILSAAMFVKFAQKTSRSEKWNYYLIVLITLMPYVGIVFNLFNVGSTYLDYAAFSMPLMSLLLFSVLFSNDLLRLKSFARDKIFEKSNDGILLLSRNYFIQDFNQAAKSIFPTLSERNTNLPLSSMISGYNDLIRAIETNTKYQLDLDQNGIPRHFYVATTEILSNGGRFIGYFVTFSDVSAIVQSNIRINGLAMALDEEKNLLKTTLLSVGDGVVSTDIKANVVLMNSIAENLTGWSQIDAAGHSIDEVLRMAVEAGISGELTLVHPVSRILSGEKSVELEQDAYLLSREQKKIPIEINTSPIYNDEGIIAGAVIVFRDYSEKKKRKEMVQFLSFHDQLTGVFNRRYFDDQIDELNKDEYLPVSLVMMDVNGLKLANDAFGHMTGDRLLQFATRIIQQHCRPTDVFSRVGGDEFVILMPHTNEAEAEEFVSKVQTDLTGHHVGELEISISFGWDTRFQKDRHLKEVYKKAEDQMYQHKLLESPAMRRRTIDRIIKDFLDKDPIEKLHSENVGDISARLSTALGLSSHQIEETRLAGALHDIGKTAIDSKVIYHSNLLSETDWLETKRHVELGYRILSAVNEMVPLAEIVLAHHENWDGSGYPKGLAGEQIPLQARIVRIADSYGAMTSDRIYRKSIGKDNAIRELEEGAGRLFDPVIVRVFVDIMGNV